VSGNSDVESARTQYEVVPLRLEHVEGFHACLDSVARERRFIAFLEAPPLDRLRRFVAKGIEEQVPQFVALQAGLVAGWCDIFPNHREGFRHGGRLGMGVMAGHRRAGVGSALLTASLARAAEVGLWRIELEVYSDNAAAGGLYAKFEFAAEGTKIKARVLDGASQDLLLMARLAE
jgi:GNAT superfamily N-acetyltransferase